MAERFGRLVLSVLVGFVVARYLGPAQFGVLNYAFAVVALGSALAGMGVEAVVRRELIQSPADAPSALAAVWCVRLVAGTVCYVGVLGWALWAETGSTARWILVVAGLLLFQPAFSVPDLWLQANLLARRAVPPQLVALGAGTAMRLALVAMGASLVSFAVVAVAEAFLSAGLLLVVARRAGMRVIGTRTRALAWRLLGESWPLLLSSITVMVYMRIDVIMLQRMAGADAAGIYSAAVRISELGYFIPTALASSLLPALIRSREAGHVAYRARLQRYFDASAALAYGMLVPTALAAHWLVKLAYGAEFDGAGAVLALHIWALPFVFLGVARGQFLVNEKLTRFAFIATTVGALTNVGLNMVLIPRAGPVGAAWATIISYAIAAWGTSFFHAGVRGIGWMQTRALLLPLNGWRYFAGK